MVVRVTNAMVWTGSLCATTVALMTTMINLGFFNLLIAKTEPFIFVDPSSSTPASP
jgi:hypothetical protein